jgi:hypothetical protein
MIATIMKQLFKQQPKEKQAARTHHKASTPVPETND